MSAQEQMPFEYTNADSNFQPVAGLMTPEANSPEVVVEISPVAAIEKELKKVRAARVRLIEATPGTAEWIRESNILLQAQIDYTETTHRPI